MNYDKKRFRSLQNTPNGEVSGDTFFDYHQDGDLVWAEYSGGSVRRGHLIGKVDAEGRIDMRYHHLNERGELMTGVCFSTPEILENGKIRLFESWRWTSGDGSSGHSVIEEV